MKIYKDYDQDSGISTYEYDNHSITIKFKHGGVYIYTYQSAGSLTVEAMKRLADCGDGLHSYINRNKPKFSSKR